MPAQQHRPAMPIVFDTSGLRPHENGRTWVDSASGDAVSLQVNDGPPFDASWMSGLAALRKGFARMFADAGCLIEADLVPFGGARAVYQLVKVPMPNAAHGQVFLAIFTLTKSPAYAQLIYQAPERGTTGVRESMLFMRLGTPADWTRPHPYDPELRTKLPFHRGDEPGWDAQFPDHPLSRARRWATHAARSAVVEPSFAALPELGGH
ncbi:hypothetical protein AB0I28_00740 [Phytomonospora sp. NPDC050363]|uniref:hypothetical protein n=1 Tax=Phytomonospora sp. NPDC050363 TaxID=3155642 RepID=UPI0033DCBE5E